MLLVGGSGFSNRTQKVEDEVPAVEKVFNSEEIVHLLLLVDGSEISQRQPRKVEEEVAVGREAENLEGRKIVENFDRKSRKELYEQAVSGYRRRKV